MATFARHGTTALGRPLPVRGGATTSKALVSASQTVGSATSYTRAGSTASAAAPSGSRTITPLGITYTRSGKIALGRIPLDRSAALISRTVVSASRIVGNPGALFDRSGLIVAGRLPKDRSGDIKSQPEVSASRTVIPRGAIDRTGGHGGGQGAAHAGLLLSLQAHPGPTISGSRRVDSNVPARSATIGVAVQLSGSRVQRRDRGGTLIAPAVLSASKVSTGNRNRNGTTLVPLQISSSRVVVHTYLRGGTLITSQAFAGSFALGRVNIPTRSGSVSVQGLVAGVAATRHLRVVDVSGVVAVRALLIGQRGAIGGPPIVLPTRLVLGPTVGDATEFRRGDTWPALYLRAEGGDGALLPLDVALDVKVRFIRRDQVSVGAVELLVPPASDDSIEDSEIVFNARHLWMPSDLDFTGRCFVELVILWALGVEETVPSSRAAAFHVREAVPA